MSQQFVRNESGTFDEVYRDFFIRATEGGFVVLNPDSTPTEYTPKTRALAVAVIDMKHRRCEALLAEAAHKVKPVIDAAAIFTAADRLAAGARKMGRHENNANDLI